MNEVNSKDTCILYNEELPKDYSVTFIELQDENYYKVKVVADNCIIGETIDDNSYSDDGYRYHDIFHFTFAAMLDWSPCTRSMMKRKRKSNPEIDRVEDGARATITEECISLMIFSRAKNKDLFKNTQDIDDELLYTIKEMTEPFEVSSKTIDDWRETIYESYRLFKLLIENKGGKVLFDTTNKIIRFEKLNFK